MAGADSITADSNIISGCFGLPRISIPKDISEIAEDARGSFYFEIRTHKGTIKASSYWGKTWDCLGTVDALEAAGLLRPEWCPGLPGNGKIRQTVLFDATGPKLVFGNKNRRTMGSPFIVIVRASKNKFVVKLVCTDEQAELLSPATQKRDQRREVKGQRERQIEEQIKKRRDKEEQYGKFYSSPSLFKDESIRFLKNIFNFSMEQLSGKYEFSEYGEATIWIDEQSMQDVLCAGARLFEAVRAAKVVCRKKTPSLSLVK